MEFVGHKGHVTTTQSEINPQGPSARLPAPQKRGPARQVRVPAPGAAMATPRREIPSRETISRPAGRKSSRKCMRPEGPSYPRKNQRTIDPRTPAGPRPDPGRTRTEGKPALKPYWEEPPINDGIGAADHPWDAVDHQLRSEWYL